MSFTIVEPVASRLNRSELAVPCSRVELFEKAAKGAADVIFLDLEDAVAPDDKERARKNCIQALNEVDWRGKTISLRINGLDTHWMYRDVVDVLEGAPDKLDLIMIPKAGTAADIYAVDMLVTQIEAATKVTRTTAGTTRAAATASHSGRYSARSLARGSASSKGEPRRERPGPAWWH